MNSLPWCKFSKSGGFRRRGQKCHLGLFTTCRQASDHPGVQGLHLGENTENDQFLFINNKKGGAGQYLPILGFKVKAFDWSVHPVQMLFQPTIRK